MINGGRIGVDWGELMKASSRLVPGLGEGEVKSRTSYLMVCSVLRLWP